MELPSFVTILSILSVFAAPFVTIWVYNRTRSDTIKTKKAQDTLDSAKLAIRSWQDLQQEYESQWRDMRARWEQCETESAELRAELEQVRTSLKEVTARLTDAEERLRVAGYHLSNGNGNGHGNGDDKVS